MRSTRAPVSVDDMSAMRAIAGVTAVSTAGALLVASPMTAVAATPAHATAAVQPRAGTLIVSSLSDSGAGSLRSAIDSANSSGGATISFSVNGTITLNSKLPDIRKPVTIDATTAPGFEMAPVVGINGAGKGTLRFVRGSSGSAVYGLSVGNSGGNGITISANKITLNQNYIGLAVNGGALGNRGDGVYISPGSRGNKIGLNPTNATGVLANVISSNRGAGLRMLHSSKNTIVANRIGTNPAGTAAMGNRHGGIEVAARSTGNKIGGNVTGLNAEGVPNNPTGTEQSVTPTFAVPPLGNLVSGNKRNGILITDGSRDNVLSGNFVGTNVSGISPIGNALDGVRITGSHNNVLRGCTVTDNPFVYYNVLSGNGRNGLHVTNSNNTVVQANFFGIGAQNNTLVPNRRNGMLFDGNSKNPHVGGVIPLGNVAAGNGWNGIEVKDRVRGFLTFNTFGGLYAFLGAAPNGRDGLLYSSAGGDATVRTNVWSGNTRHGIQVTGNAHGMRIAPNVIGLSTNGSSTLPNGGDGIRVGGSAHDNVIGGYRKQQVPLGGQFSVIPQNSVSGNAGRGIVITDRAHHNRVIHSYFGIATVPWFLLPNHEQANRKGGVLLSGHAHDNTFGTRDNRPFNVISNNIGPGVEMTRGTRRNDFFNNYIGVDRAGLPLLNIGRAVIDHGKLNRVVGGKIAP